MRNRRAIQDVISVHGLVTTITYNRHVRSTVGPGDKGRNPLASPAHPAVSCGGGA
jgi:hypothetical protein